MAKRKFKAESKKLLDMMINSIYTHKEIFLRELISNASDAIDKQYYRALGDENVNVKREDFAIWLEADRDSRTLKITDNGIGMDEETASHVFEKFYQGDNSHATAGNGLGLSLVKRIVTLMNGRVSVKSKPGSLTTFSVTLTQT